MTVAGLYAGGVETFEADGGVRLTSGIRKRKCETVALARSGIPGDASHETGRHTDDKAVHLFALANYEPIETALERTLPRPAFGENILAEGLDEDAVCVGDLWRIGGALLRVTQPTERCRTVGRSLGAPRMLRVLHQFEICGFYAAVAEPGAVAPGDVIDLCDRTRPEWPIRRLHRAMFRHLGDAPLMTEIGAIPELSPEWKQRISVMRGRLARGEPISSNLTGL